MTWSEVSIIVNLCNGGLSIQVAIKTGSTVFHKIYDE